MKLYLKRKKSEIDAIAEYNENTGNITVLKGSRVSEKIAYTEKFRGSKSIEKNRETTVVERTVIEDISFKSASTAANYVTGSSTNGLTAWKNSEGITLKDLLQHKEA